MSERPAKLPVRKAVARASDKGHTQLQPLCSRLHWRGVGLNRGKGSALFTTQGQLLRLFAARA